VSGFRLDKYLVTVGRFRQFVAAWNSGAGYLPPAGAGKHVHVNGGLGLANSGRPGTYESGWDTSWNTNIEMDLACSPPYDTWTDTAGAQENLPINCVNWFEAYAFCTWDGGFLPSEAEWGYAAAGGNQQREFPWGQTEPGMAYQYAVYACLYPYPTPYASCDGVMNIAPIGTAILGSGLWGQLDVEGDLQEFVLDWSGPYGSPCTDCAYLRSSSNRAIRGDTFGFYATPDTLHSWIRNRDAPTSRQYYYGFRCARTP
jgi:formylglycine-generating enzyme required for sulfatase activity